MCMCHHTYLTYSMYTKKINVIFHAACLTGTNDISLHQTGKKREQVEIYNSADQQTRIL